MLIPVSRVKRCRPAPLPDQIQQSRSSEARLICLAQQLLLVPQPPGSSVSSGTHRPRESKSVSFVVLEVLTPSGCSLSTSCANADPCQSCEAVSPGPLAGPDSTIQILRGERTP